MADDGETKDDVKVPDGEIGDKIEKLFRTDEKDTSKSWTLQNHDHTTHGCRCHCSYFHG